MNLDFSGWCVYTLREGSEFRAFLLLFLLVFIFWRCLTLLKRFPDFVGCLICLSFVVDSYLCGTVIRWSDSLFEIGVLGVAQRTLNLRIELHIQGTRLTFLAYCIGQHYRFTVDIILLLPVSERDPFSLADGSDISIGVCPAIALLLTLSIIFLVILPRFWYKLDTSRICIDLQSGRKGLSVPECYLLVNNRFPFFQSCDFFRCQFCTPDIPFDKKALGRHAYHLIGKSVDTHIRWHFLAVLAVKFHNFAEISGQRRSSVARVLTKYPADAVHEERQVRDTVQL